jgi:integrase
MALKKVKFEKDEEVIFDDAVIYKRGEYWQMRIWLKKEHKYARFTLKTRNKSTAIDKAKLHYHALMAQQLAGKTYFSITTKMGVEMYLAEREKDVAAGIIVKGRFSVIRTQLNHWLNIVGKDTKLKELERTQCANYFLDRTKTKKSIPVSQSTVENEQSIINAMMKWLYKRGETYIDGFDFKKLKRIDKGVDENRRATFTDAEVNSIKAVLTDYIKEAESDIEATGNLSKAITGYYLGFSLISGLRRGEQLQLRWCDVVDMEHGEARSNKRGGNKFDLIQIVVRGETSKVGKTRKLVVKDSGYFSGLLHLKNRLLGKDATEATVRKKLGQQLMFSVNGTSPLTPRAIGYHFERIMQLSAITGLEKRDLVPYSFRHYFITQRVNSNLPPAAVAEMCGTSITQIEKTYYHTTAEKMVSNALADYTYIDGMLVPK